MKHSKACWQNPNSTTDLDGILPDQTLPVAGVTATTTAATSIISQSFPAGTLKAGMHGHVVLYGIISTAAATPTFTFRLLTPTGTVLDLVTTTIASMSGRAIRYDLHFHVISATAIVGHARCTSDMTAFVEVESATTAAGGTIAASTDTSIGVSVLWQTADASNTATFFGGYIEWTND